ncbi:MAG: glycosyltransferase family 2 protein [Pseudomonadota bacterium]
MSARNESASIADVIHGFRCKAQELGLDLSVQVVDDGSTDSTSKKAAGAGASVYRFSSPVGLAAAFNRELALAAESGVDYVVHVDADGQHSPGDLPKFIEKAMDNYDLILGNRLHVRPAFFADWQYHGNIFISEIVSNLLGVAITDSQTGYRVFSRDVATTIKIMGSVTYTQEQILRAVCASFTVIEIPIATQPRLHETSRIVGDPLHYMATVFNDLLNVSHELGLTWPQSFKHKKQTRAAYETAATSTIC